MKVKSIISAILLLSIISSCQNRKIFFGNKYDSTSQRAEFEEDKQIVKLEQQNCYNLDVMDGWYCENLVIEIKDLSFIQPNNQLNIHEKNPQIKLTYDKSSVWNWNKEDVKISGELLFLEVNEGAIILKQNISVTDLNSKRKYHFKGKKVFERKIDISQLEGIWEVHEIFKSGKKMEKPNECDYKKEILFETNKTELVELQNYKIRGKRIGKSNFKICTLNPETYEYEIATNSCYNSLVRDLHNNRIWYEMGEGMLIKYKISFNREIITMKEVKDYLNKDRDLKILNLKKKS